MANAIDYLLVGGIGYYFYNKSIKGKDEELKRLLMGAGTGLLAAYKGPEILNAGEKFISGKTDELTKDKLTGTLVGAAAGYLWGNKVVDSFKSAYSPNKE
ncbi:hypothetical protein COV13_03420, partial [Candidatus Woesearchaeota archaeon CG10_big_fil_rev_8_21_14_0_10_32_9]